MRLSACLLLALLTAACDDDGPSAGMDPTPDVTVQPIADAAPVAETCDGKDND